MFDNTLQNYNKTSYGKKNVIKTCPASGGFKTTSILNEYRGSTVKCSIWKLVMIFRGHENRQAPTHMISKKKRPSTPFISLSNYLKSEDLTMRIIINCNKIWNFLVSIVFFIKYSGFCDKSNRFCTHISFEIWNSRDEIEISEKKKRLEFWKLRFSCDQRKVFQFYCVLSDRADFNITTFY